MKHPKVPKRGFPQFSEVFHINFHRKEQRYLFVNLRITCEKRKVNPMPKPSNSTRKGFGWKDRESRRLFGICTEDGYQKALPGRMRCAECTQRAWFQQAIRNWLKEGNKL